MSKIISSIKLLLKDRDLFMERLMDYIGSDRQYIKYWFKNKMGYYPNLDDPKTFNEKLQWLKLYYRKPILTTLVDKYAVKKYVADKIGEEYIIPTLGVWNSFDDIDFERLPNQFVLKCTHDSGGIVICKDKAKLDIQAARKKIERSLSTDFYKLGREWPYKNVPRRIIAEQYMEEVSKPESEDLIDYKFFCFKGQPTYCQVIRDRSTKETIDFYDMEWNHMPFIGLSPVASNGILPVVCPSNFEDMKRICRELSKDIPFCRIDLYEVNRKEFFGEITLFPGCGIGTFTPVQWNEKLGDMIDLQGVNGGGYRCILNRDLIIIPAVGELRDYKFFCFDGKPKWLFIATDRQNREEPYFDFYDMEFNHLDMRHGHPNAPFEIPKPKNFELMKELSSKLSKGFPHVRVDLYEVNGKVFFGELTFFHHTGRVLFDPIKWDTIFGNEINLQQLIN